MRRIGLILPVEQRDSESRSSLPFESDFNRRRDIEGCIGHIQCSGITVLISEPTAFLARAKATRSSEMSTPTTVPVSATATAISSQRKPGPQPIFDNALAGTQAEPVEHRAPLRHHVGARIDGLELTCGLVAELQHGLPSTITSFDDLVGAGEKGRGNFEPKRLCRFQI